MRRDGVLRPRHQRVALSVLLVAGPQMNACAMVTRCLRHQMSDLFGGPEVAEPAVPPSVRWGPGETYEVRPGLGEPEMGDPDHIPLD